jgi:hypothetical protein
MTGMTPPQRVTRFLRPSRGTPVAETFARCRRRFGFRAIPAVATSVVIFTVQFPDQDAQVIVHQRRKR